MFTTSTTATEVTYTPIGFGKPLSIEIMTLYTGAFRKKGLFPSAKSDILVVSGVKAEETFDATPRAVNLLAGKTGPNSYLDFSAFNNGTRYVYYKQAVDSDSIDVTIELSESSMLDGIANTLSDLLAKAAGLPIFLPAEGKLLAGAQLVNIAAQGAHELFTPAPFFNETFTIQFDTAGLPENSSQSMLLCREVDKAELSGYQVESVDVNGSYMMRLTKDGQVYSGAAPYVVLNVDGAAKPSLQSWTATVASSGLLSRFYGSTDKVDSVGQVVQEAMSLYNDYSYRTRAALFQQQLKNTPAGSDEYTKLQSQYQAALANIQNDYFKNGLSGS